MNLPQTKILLEKIITLYKTLSSDENNISLIERDLMKSYVRQLYEAVIDAPPTPSFIPSGVSTTNKATQATAAPKVEMPKATPPPSPPPVHQPIVVEQPKPVYEQPKPVYEAPQPIYEAPKVMETPRYTPPPPIEQPKPTPASYAPHTPQVPHEIEALFEDITGKELSDKLANTPIADLTKAFGFNDRLLTQNELFGGNKAVADEVIKDLNNMSGFETARGFLLSLATKYNWAANEDRKKQAKTFIKLVRRRFR